MTLAARSNFIHSDMQVPNSYTANISTAQNTLFLCVQFQCTKLCLVFNPTHGLGHGWFSVGICKYKPGYKSHDLLKFDCSHWLKLQHSDWRANLVKDFFKKNKFSTNERNYTTCRILLRTCDNDWHSPCCAQYSQPRHRDPMSTMKALEAKLCK